VIIRASVSGAPASPVGEFMIPLSRKFAALLLCSLVLPAALAAQQPLGIFEGQQDVGTILHPGSAHYDPANSAYLLTGSGDNLWWAEDDLHFVWKKVSGDFALTADIALLGAGGDPHRKAVLMVRQTLDANSATVVLAVHGDGLTSLQWRAAAGENMHEVQANVKAPATVRLEKHGDSFYAFVPGTRAHPGPGPEPVAGNSSSQISPVVLPMIPSGASTRVVFTAPFYVGIGVCAHNKDAVQQASFTRLRFEPLSTASAAPVLVSALETIPIASTDRHVEYAAVAHFEAPNWTRDGSALVFNQDGTLRRLTLGSPSSDVDPEAEPQPEVLDTAPETHLNNDHGLSPDGSMLAFSDSSAPDHQSRVYVVPLAGGTPRQLTPDGPSYWHGWSPDGKTLAFTGERNGNFDIYTVPFAGGAETRLTTAPDLDDGPEYSPDGAHIYFNAERTGRMQIWRMKPDGSSQEQVVSDQTNDWFPHLSPDGQWMVFLAYAPDVSGHPPNQDVELRLMSMADGKVRVLTRLFGGQGTINVPSWSPDSKKIAFVSYELLPADRLGAQ
jgi:TolB protein